MKTYVYISTAKIDELYAQLPRIFADGEKIRAGINIGVLKLELEKGDSNDGNQQKMDTLIEHLRKQGHIGSIDEPKRFFQGTMDATCIIDGNFSFFGGVVPGAGDGGYVGLVGSLRHMIGGEYRKMENDEMDWWQSKEGVGPAQAEVFRKTSNNIAFSWQLRRIWEKNESFGSAQLDFATERENRLSALRLTDEEIAAIQCKSFANPVLRWLVRHDWSLFAMMFGSTIRRIIGLSMETRLLESKFDALSREARLLDDQAASARLQQEDTELLDAVRGATRWAETPKQRYEFVAMTLLDGRSGNARVRLGTPIYIAAERYSW